MNIKKLLMSSMLMLSFVSASAQEPEVKTVYDFKPHWYVQVQPLGGQYTLGELDFGDLLSYNVQAAVGYQFHEALGVRLSVDAWQSKGGSVYFQYSSNEKKFDWAWKYVAPTVDLSLNLSNLICGYNPNRVFNLSILGGVGANIAFSNDDARQAKTDIVNYVKSLSPENDIYQPYQDNPPLSLAWYDTKVSFLGRFGVAGDFRISDRLSAGVEFTANTLTDAYNSKPAGNSDWYFNANAGIKFALGDTYTSRTVSNQPRVIERVVEKVVEKPVQVAAPVTNAVTNTSANFTDAGMAVAKEPLRRDIFFTINSTTITPEENQKVLDIVEYLKQYPEAKVVITGYADKGTGNASINARLGNNRAQAVVNALVKKYGIAASRISSSSKGDTVQPFQENDKNRVSICVAE